MMDTIILKDLYTTLIDNVADIKGEKCAFFSTSWRELPKRNYGHW